MKDFIAIKQANTDKIEVVLNRCIILATGISPHALHLYLHLYSVTPASIVVSAQRCNIRMQTESEHCGMMEFAVRLAGSHCMNLRRQECVVGADGAVNGNKNNKCLHLLELCAFSPLDQWR